MILKEKDSMDGQFQQLEQLLTQPLPPLRQKQLEKELALLRAGRRGELEAAYHIDFHLKDSNNWAVIHDLRLEWNERVAQIDHLLIDRFLQIYVVESKSFRTKIRYAHGGWERLNFNHWEGIACPVSQNERHIAVLQELIKDKHLAPKRLGLTLSPTFFNIVLVQPSCSIQGNYPEDVRIYRVDQFVKKIRAEDPRGLEIILKVVSPETLQDFALDLVADHKPAPQSPILPPPGPTPPPIQSSTHHPPSPLNTQTCQTCGGPLSQAEQSYCQAHEERFTGQLLCRKCQGDAPKQKPATTPVVARLSTTVGIKGAARCIHCQREVDSKVVAFCRFNSKRFAGRILCRDCQDTLHSPLSTV